jgi:hypothetical protein
MFAALKLSHTAKSVEWRHCEEVGIGPTTSTSSWSNKKRREKE